MDYEFKVWMTQPMVNVSFTSGEIVVRDNNLVALQHKFIHLKYKEN